VVDSEQNKPENQVGGQLTSRARTLWISLDVTPG
jgi:hypothetical protein